ncbi:MAG: archaeosine biosynthesis radical SAM protein RaSEA [Methanomicrobiales archaeon]|nr:archaeosine biosynthesis radical SAM protein RaSEA [Methanomicrobiales archaeon]
MVFEEYEKPAACWAGIDSYKGQERKCLTIILRSGGCTWGSCLMCGYTHVRYGNRDPAFLDRKIRAQISWIKREFNLDDYSLVKIFTSGSFLDPQEVPPDTQQEVIRAFRGKVVILETRPEYVEEERVSILRETADTGMEEIPLYLAMGLETTHDFIREKSIRKGLTTSDFIGGAERAHRAGAGVKTYLLMKPPFLTEQEAIQDMITSAQEAWRWSDLISLNLCTVQSSTPVEWLWRNGAYRPPYLWSVLSVLSALDRPISCDPVGGGTPRGPHNCGACDPELVDGIRTYSLTGDHSLIDALLQVKCGCKEEWRYVLENEMSYSLPLTR